MITKFLVEYTDDQNYLVRDLFKIAQRYLKGTFATEFFLLIPFNVIFEFRYSRLFFFLKAYRIISVFDIIKHKYLMSHVKTYYKKRLDKLA